MKRKSQLKKTILALPPKLKKLFGGANIPADWDHKKEIRKILSAKSSYRVFLSYSIIWMHLLFCILAFSCKKDKKAETPNTIYIEGIVTDKQTSTPLDSVKIYLIKHLVGSSIISDVFFNKK